MKEFDDSIEQVSEDLKILAHKDRLKILCFLGDGEKNVSQIESAVGISQSQTSQFLQKMKMLNIVSAEKRGKEIFYTIEDQNIYKIIMSLRSIYC